MDINDQITDEVRSTTSARKWAERFCDFLHPFEMKLLGERDDAIGLMEIWFANAIETGRSAGLRMHFDESPQRLEPLAELSDVEQMFMSYNWVITEQFKARYLLDPWVYNLTNALLDTWKAERDKTAQNKETTHG